MYYKDFMKFDQIECFLKLSETLNFSETALLLGLTQPSITRKIQALEESLQANLFIRSKHSVRLTGSGQDLLKRVKPLFNEFGALMNHTQDTQKNLTGPLRIGVLPEIGKNFFYSRFLEFKKIHPDLDLQVEYALNHENLPKLMDGKLDFVIVNQLPTSELYRSYKIMQEKAVMVTRAQNKNIKKEISEQHFVAYSPHDGLLNLYLKSFYRPMDNSKVKKLSSVNEHASMIQLLLQTDSLAVMPWFSVESHLKSGELKLADNNEKVSAFYLVELNKNWRSKKEQEFRTFLIQNLKSRT
jgi:DNA-binding transcriptional LysR family regulator